ncbi:MAG: general secretion pathway protein GspC [Betaproteobacteria bacterium]|nr:general secretion pathway protein GspC [Betaproteobacteria bacterium]MDE2131863.1 general secretion pathway protein GspC [Betaproteobacteria bacterium]MDE2211670.1 general secretion pathway protein GspC [Betaproteobacteria bacterium]
MATLRFYRPTPWMPALASISAAALLAAVLGFWAMRLFAPAPLPLPSAVLQERTDSSGLVWSGLFSGRNVGPIVLRGVVAAGPADSAAVLSVNGAPGRAYRVGQEVAPGVRLVAVDTRSAVLERNGVRETLPLPARGSSAKIGPAPAR